MVSVGFSAGCALLQEIPASLLSIGPLPESLGAWTDRIAWEVDSNCLDAAATDASGQKPLSPGDLLRSGETRPLRLHIENDTAWILCRPVFLDGNGRRVDLVPDAGPRGIAYRGWVFGAPESEPGRIEVDTAGGVAAWLLSRAQSTGSDVAGLNAAKLRSVAAAKDLDSIRVDADFAIDEIVRRSLSYYDVKGVVEYDFEPSTEAGDWIRGDGTVFRQGEGSLSVPMGEIFFFGPDGRSLLQVISTGSRSKPRIQAELRTF